MPSATRRACSTCAPTVGSRTGDSSSCPSCCGQGDLLVVNETRVRRARLTGSTGRGRRWSCWCSPGSRAASTSASRVLPGWPTPGAVITIGPDLTATVTGISTVHRGGRTVTFDARPRRSRSNGQAWRRCPPTFIRASQPRAVPDHVCKAATQIRRRHRLRDCISRPSRDRAAARRAHRLGDSSSRRRAGDVRADSHRARRASPDARGALHAPGRNRPRDRASAARRWPGRRGRDHCDARARDVRARRHDATSVDGRDASLHPSRHTVFGPSTDCSPIFTNPGRRCSCSSPRSSATSDGGRHTHTRSAAGTASSRLAIACCAGAARDPRSRHPRG